MLHEAVHIRLHRWEVGVGNVLFQAKLADDGRNLVVVGVIHPGKQVVLNLENSIEYLTFAV